jgi:hypothetical protein
MGFHIYGNDPNQTLTVTSGDISDNLVIFGNGAGDNVLAEDGNVIQNIIAFGNGVGDKVESTGNVNHDIITFSDVAGTFTTPPDFVIASDAISNDIITFGNGFGDNVRAQDGDVTQNVITFGDGGGDTVRTPFNLNQDTITFGNGGREVVTASNANQDVIVFGKGGGREVAITAQDSGGAGPGNLSNSSITFHDVHLRVATKYLARALSVTAR